MAERPRILHVIFSLDAAGTEVAALRLLRFWQNDVDQSVVSFTRASGALERDFRHVAPLTVVSDRAETRLELFHAVRRECARMDADAIIIHSFGVHHLVVAAAGRSAGVTAIACSAGNPPPRSRSGRKAWSRVVTGSRLLGCRIAGCSLTVQRQLEDLGARMPKGSFAIPHGIDVSSESAPSLLNRGTARFVIGMVARLDPIKDHATLLKAFAIVAQDDPEAELRIIGDGPLRPQLEDLARHLDIDERTKFLGRRNDVDDQLDEMNVFAFSTTEDEGFGIVMIEAMAAALPIVASDAAACREVLGEGEAGLIVSQGDIDGFARALKRIANEPATAARLADAARNRVRREYSTEKFASRWLSILGLNGEIRDLIR